MRRGYAERKIRRSNAGDVTSTSCRRHGDLVGRWVGGERQPRDGLVFAERADGLLRCIGAQSGGAADEAPGEERIASRRSALAAQRACRGRRERSGEQES